MASKHYRYYIYRKKLFIKGFNIKNRSSALDQGKLQILIASTKIKKYHTSRNLKEKNVIVIFLMQFFVTSSFGTSIEWDRKEAEQFYQIPFQDLNSSRN